jgi:selenocysteine lyase/cysteine desulfurase
MEVVTEHLTREALHGPSEAGVEVAPAVQEVRRKAARLFGAGEDEVAVVGSGSQGWGMAFASLPPLAAGDRVLIGRAEWGGNLSTLHAAARRAGARIDVIPCEEDGTTSADALAAMIDDDVRLVALTWCPATNGLINPAAAIGKLTRAAGVPFFVDAGQALGQLPMDVEAIGCDVLKGAGRKALRGPRGTALVYIRQGYLEQLEPPYLDVLSAPWRDGGPHIRADARRFETSENSFALQLGFGAALDLALDLGLEAIRAQIDRRAKQLRRELEELPNLTVHDGGSEQSGIVTFTVAGTTAAAVKERLSRNRINVAAIGAAYAPLDMDARGLSEVVRASLSYLNTDDEIDTLVAAVRNLD